VSSDPLDRYSPHLLAGALCLGLASSNVARLGAPVVLAAAAAGAAVSAALEGPRRSAALAIALAVGGAWWGAARLDAIDRSVLAPRLGEVGRALLEVTGPTRRTPFQLRVPARMHRFRGTSLREPVLLQLPLGRSPPQGALIESVVELKAPRGPSEGFDERTFLRRRGIHVVARGRGWSQVGRRGGIGGVADRIHRELARSIAPGLSGERRAVLDGLVLGEDEGLSQELRDRFRSSGLYHLLAVSGSNVAFVAGGVLLVAWLAGISRLVAELGALAAIGAYVLAVGWQPSVVRAGVAGALASLAWLASRPRDRWYFLLLGAALLLAWSPYSLLDPGFQLSFAAVAAIFLAVPAVQRTLEGYPVPGGLREVVAVSGACGVATAPILLLQFGSVPTYSILSNALAAPAVAPSFGLALLTAVLAHLLPPAALAAAWVNGWLAAYIAGCAKVIGGLPGAQVSSTFAIVAVGGAALLLYAMRRLPRWRRPGLLVLAGLSALFLVGWQLRATRPPPPPTGLRLTVLDVGQGDGILLQVPEGAVLVDEGPPEAHVDRQLRDLGVRRLALMVFTHPQRDHIGGAADVLRHVRVDRILDPQLPSPSADEDAARAQAAKRAVPVSLARAGRAFTLGRLRLRVLWPDGPGLPGADPNDHATIVLASFGKVDALLTADAESPVTVPLNPPQVEIMKVAHHGSADEGLERLLQLTRPSIAIISCGLHNDYGHPAPSTLGTLEAAPHLTVFRTDLDGRVVVESDGNRISTWSQH
jgi:competence protein ComEC